MVAERPAHRFAFSVTRALRQAMLRVSFRLAPWLATRSLDLPADKTRDASNRRLPLERLPCTRTRAFPARCRGFHRVDAFADLGSAPADRGRGRFTTPSIASADRIIVHAFAPCLSSRLAGVGVFLPTVSDAIVPLTLLSPPLLRLRFRRAFARTLRTFCFRISCGPKAEGAAKDTVATFS